MATDSHHHPGTRGPQPLLLLIVTLPAGIAYGFVTIATETLPVLALVAFLLMAGTTFIMVPLGGLMAYAVPGQFKGRAAGYFQAGNLAGIGLGGGAGVWLGAHAPSLVTAGLVLGSLSLACVIGLRAIPDPVRVSSGRFISKILMIGHEFWDLIKHPNGAIVAALLITPIGLGAADNLWSAIADEWQASPDGVALVTGVCGALVGAAGSLIGGWCADRADRRIVYLAGGAILSLVGAGFAVTPRTPAAFAAGTLGYSMMVGFCNAAYTGMILGAIGHGAAASKFTILNSLGNLPLSYMTAFDGWVHDRSNSTTMLVAEAAVCLFLIGIAGIALRKVREIRSVPGARPFHPSA